MRRTPENALVHMREKEKERASWPLKSSTLCRRSTLFFWCLLRLPPLRGVRGGWELLSQPNLAVPLLIRLPSAESGLFESILHGIPGCAQGCFGGKGQNHT